MDIRSQFPIFQAHPNLVYLDSAATALKPQSVIDAITNYYSQYSSNIHRGLYPIAEQASQAYEQSREIVAQFINANTPAEVIFTKSTTDGLNLLASCLNRYLNLTTNDQILTTELEHHANLVPWQQLPSKLYFLPLLGGDQEGVLTDFRLDLEKLPQLLTPQTKILTLSHVSNVTGTIQPIKEIIQLAKQLNPNIITIVDGAQAVPHIPVDVQDLGCDFYVFSGHKLYGPTGIGVLWGRSELLDQLPPYQTGGDMIETVSLNQSTFNRAPSKFEAGTPHIAGAIGLAAAIKFVQSSCHTELAVPRLTRDSGSAGVSEKLESRHKLIHSEELSLMEYALNQLSQIPNLQIFGLPAIASRKGGTDSTAHRIGTISFTIQGIHPHDIAQFLGESNICIRAGHHCTMPLHKEIFQIPATARISLGLYNTKEDVDKCIQALYKAVTTFKT